MAINIMIDDQVIELSGDELKRFEAQRAKDFAESESLNNAKIAAKNSALAKLEALGLTTDEINGLIS
jgi:hypothetical protein